MNTDTVRAKDNVVKSWVCSGSFDDAMLKGFLTFNEGLQKDGDTDAIIYIDSPGGFVHSLNSILSVMENSSIRWHTCVIGEASSAALILLASGTYRYAGPKARMMYHTLAFGTQGKVDSVQEDADESKLLNLKVQEDFARKTKKSAAWWKAKTKTKESRDFWFYSESALEYGVIDKIGVPKARVSVTIE